MGDDACPGCGGFGRVVGHVAPDRYPRTEYAWYPERPSAPCPICRVEEWCNGGRNDPPTVVRRKIDGALLIRWFDDGDGSVYVDHLWGDMATGWFAEAASVEPFGAGDGR